MKKIVYNQSGEDFHLQERFNMRCFVAATSLLVLLNMFVKSAGGIWTPAGNWSSVQSFKNPVRVGYS